MSLETLLSPYQVPLILSGILSEYLSIVMLLLTYGLTLK